MEAENLAGYGVQFRSSFIEQFDNATRYGYIESGTRESEWLTVAVMKEDGEYIRTLCAWSDVLRGSLRA